VRGESNLIFRMKVVVRNYRCDCQLESGDGARSQRIPISIPRILQGVHRA